MFVKQYKRGMNIDSHFGIIFDKKGYIFIPSTQTINDLISKRTNDDISIKIAVKPDNWQVYTDTNDQFIERVHDYGMVELDDSYKVFIKTLKKSNY